MKIAEVRGTLMRVQDGEAKLTFLRLQSTANSVVWYEALANGWQELPQEAAKQVEADFQIEELRKMP